MIAVTAEGHSLLSVTNLEPVIGPGAKLERALLLVKGEEERVEGAGAVEHGLRHPQDVARVLHHHQGLAGLLQPVVRTASPTQQQGMKGNNNNNNYYNNNSNSNK